MHFIQQLLPNRVEVDPASAAVGLMDDSGARLVDSGDRIADVRKVTDAFPVAAEVAATDLSGTFEQMAHYESLSQLVVFVPPPVEFVYQRREEQAGVRHAASHDDVGAASQRLDERLCAKVGV